MRPSLVEDGSIMRPRVKLILALLAYALACFGQTPQEKQAPPYFDYEQARSHELKPHRWNIPMNGVQDGFNQFHITLRVSESGEVLSAQAEGEPEIMKF